MHQIVVNKLLFMLFLLSLFSWCRRLDVGQVSQSNQVGSYYASSLGFSYGFGSIYIYIYIM